MFLLCWCSGRLNSTCLSQEYVPWKRFSFFWYFTLSPITSNNLHWVSMSSLTEHFQKYSKKHPALLQDCSMLQQDTKPLHLPPHLQNILFPRQCKALAWVSTRHHNSNKIYSSVSNSDFKVNQVHSRPQERSCWRVREKISGKAAEHKIKTFYRWSHGQYTGIRYVKKGTFRCLPSSQH